MTKTSVYSILGGFIVAASTASVATVSYAQTAGGYPDRPVRVVVGFTAGGPVSSIGQILADRLSQSLGQNFYLDFVPGAGGNIAAAQVAQEPADGYTLHIVSTGFIVNPSVYSGGTGYDPIEDYDPISMLAVSPNVLTINKSLEVDSVKGLIDTIKSNPDRYSYGHPGIGSTPHLNGELFKLDYELDLVTVPFLGTGQLMPSVLSGDTPIAFMSLPSAMQFIDDGSIRALAVLSETRIERLPDVPSSVESGIQGHEGDTIIGLLAPAGTPEEIIDLLNKEVVAALDIPDVQERLMALGFGPVGSTPQVYGDRIASEIERWTAVIKEAGIRID